MMPFDLEEFKGGLGELIKFARDNSSALSDETKLMFGQFLEKAGMMLSDAEKAPVARSIPDTAKLLWELSGRNPEPFTEYLSQFPAPELQQIANSANVLKQTIDTLQREMPQEKLGQMDGIPEAWLQSSNVYGYQYDPRSRKLKVRFHNGGVYEYSGIPEAIYKLFDEGAIPARTNDKQSPMRFWRGKKPSLGASLHWLVKAGKFTYEKLQ